MQHMSSRTFVIVNIMSDGELSNQALLLHLWWTHREVSPRPRDRGGEICALYEKLRAFRGSRGVELHQVTERM